MRSIYINTSPMRIDLGDAVLIRVLMQCADGGPSPEGAPGGRGACIEYIARIAPGSYLELNLAPGAQIGDDAEESRINIVGDRSGVMWRQRAAIPPRADRHAFAILQLWDANDTTWDRSWGVWPDDLVAVHP